MTRKSLSLYLVQRRRKLLTFPLISFVAIVLMVIGSPSSANASSLRSTATSDVQVNVNTHNSLGKIPDTAFGANTAVWDGNLLDKAVPSLLSQADVKVMRYPGGSTSDVFHWQTNTVEPSNQSAGLSSFDKFMQVVHRTGAQPMITVNYGSGTPQEAAAWVKYANITKDYHIKYWEIGNEVYGNGSYGANWEYDTHAQKGPAAYAQNALSFIKAMKSVDPSIKIGIVLTTPGDWPDGVIAPGDTMDWNHTVLSTIGSQFDFAAVHWYTDYAPDPNHVTDAGLLANPAQIPAKVTTLRSLFTQYSGTQANSKQIMITETNSVPYNPGKQTVSLVNALFLDEDYMTWLENGVTNVDWWDTHNGMVTNGDNDPSLYGTTNYGDYGMLANGSTANGLSEPPANTPFPSYYGLQMLTKLGRAGDRMVQASSNNSLVVAFAVKKDDGKLAILLINTDPSNTHDVALSFTGYTPTPHATVYFYGENSKSITEIDEHGLSSTQSQSLPPYSLTTIELSAK